MRLLQSLGAKHQGLLGDGLGFCGDRCSWEDVHGPEVAFKESSL